MNLLLSAFAVGAGLAPVAGFSSALPRHPSKTSRQGTFLTASSMNNEELSATAIQTTQPTQKGKKRSEAIPLMDCPPVLMASDLAGNVGFDPLGLVQNEEQLLQFREAEIKHARLAMLAVIGWPMSEVMDRSIAAFFQIPAMLDDGDRVPSTLNGGLNKIDPRYWGFCIGLCAAIDVYGASKARQEAPGYFPGNLGFDPLQLFPWDKEGQESMKLAEIKHGRSAMIAVLVYAVEEFVTKTAVVDNTPMLFQPITKSVEEVIFGAIDTIEGALHHLA